MAAPKPKAANDATLRSGKVKFDSTTIGSTGLRQWGGIVDEEFLKDLRGHKAVQVYREMSDNDAIVGAIIYAISMLMRESKWTFTAADESTEAEDAKAFVEDVFKNMTSPIEDVIDEVCSMFVYGWSVHEIIWCRRDDGQVGVQSISLRAQTTLYKWEIDPADGTIDGFWQQPWSGPSVFIPIEKLLLFRTTVQRNNPEGRSLLRTAYRAWRNKKRIEEIEAVGIERDLAGLPFARIPGSYFSIDADQDQKATLLSYQTLVRNVRLDKQQGIVLPSDTDSKGKYLFDFSLLGGSSTRAVETTKVIERYDKQIATSVLADFIFLGQSSRGTGSYALSSDKTAMFSSAVGGFLRAIASVFNRHLLPRLWTLNAFDPATMPDMQPGDLESADLEKLGMYITALAGAGMALFPDHDLENHLREEGGLPLAPEEGSGYEGPPMPTAGPGAAMAVASHAASLPQPEPAPAGPPGQSRQNAVGKARRGRASSKGSRAKPR